MLTKVFNNIFRDKIESHPVKEDPGRCEEFAENLLFLADEEMEISSNEKKGEEPENIFEALTYGLTILDDSDVKLNCHIDKFNDPHYGFNILMSVYFHHFYEPIQKTVRVAFLGYTRKCVFEYYRRKKNYENLNKQIQQYLQCIGMRNDYSLQNAITLQQARNNEFVFCIPFIDKCAFYSLFVYSIELFIDHVTTKKKTIYFEDLIEVITTIGWLTSPKLFYLTIQHWIDTNSIPKGNLCVAMIKYIVDTFGGLSCTDGPRLQTFCNDNLKYHEILSAHKHIRNTILMANFSTPDKECHFMLMKELQNIRSVGPLSSQHILSVLSLTKIIKYTYFATNALLCPFNRTKTMFWQHYGLNENTMNTFYEKIADKYFDGRTAMSENLGCEFLRDMYRNKQIPEKINQKQYNENLKKRCVNKIRFPDTFIGSQYIYKVEKIDDDDRIYKYKWETEKGKVVRVEYLLQAFMFDEDRTWIHNSDYVDPELIVVTNNKNEPKKIKRRPTIRKNPPKKVLLKRKKLLDELENIKKENYFSFDLPLPNFDVDSNAEIHPESWMNVSSEEKDEIMNKLKQKDATSPTPSTIELLDDDDLSELNDVEMDEDFDPAELIKIVYDEAQEYVIKMLEDSKESISPFDIFYFSTDHSWYTDKIVKIQLNQLIQSKLNLTSIGDRKRFVKYDTYPNKKDGKVTFHAYINSSSRKVFVSSYAWKQYSLSFNGYKPCQITSKKRLLVSQYRNKEDAKKALLIYCLTELNYNLLEKSIIKEKWYEKYLPFQQKESSIAIFDTNGQINEFFGILHVSQHAEYKLLIPVDHKADVYLKWQIFHFEP